MSRFLRIVVGIALGENAEFETGNALAEGCRLGGLEHEHEGAVFHVFALQGFIKLHALCRILLVTRGFRLGGKVVVLEARTPQEGLRLGVVAIVLVDVEDIGVGMRIEIIRAPGPAQVRNGGARPSAIYHLVQHPE